MQPAFPLFTPATFNGLQNLDASKPFTLNWNVNTPPSAANDPSNFLLIYNTTTGTLVYNDGGGFLGPNVTSATLSANTLLPNTSYFADLIFSDRIDDANNPGADITDSNGTTFGPVQAFELHNRVDFTTASAAVPESSPLALLALGLLPLGLLARRRTARRAA